MHNSRFVRDEDNDDPQWVTAPSAIYNAPLGYLTVVSTEVGEGGDLGTVVVSCRSVLQTRFEYACQRPALTFCMGPGGDTHNRSKVQASTTGANAAGTVQKNARLLSFDEV